MPRRKIHNHELYHEAQATVEVGLPDLGRCESSCLETEKPPIKKGRKNSTETSQLAIAVQAHDYPHMLEDL